MVGVGREVDKVAIAADDLCVLHDFRPDTGQGIRKYELIKVIHQTLSRILL